MLVMFDTITLDTMPPSPMAVGGYVGGSWPTYNRLVQKFPHAHHLSIAPQASMRARCLDVEPGDAANSEAPGWFHANADHSQGKPVLYTSAGNTQALVDTMSNNGIPRGEYLIWSAHFTYQPHICGGGTCGYPDADGTQWTDHALGRNLDESLIGDGFFGPKPKPPPPPDPYHYQRFVTELIPWNGQEIVERDVVEHYDGARKHPWRYHKLLTGDLRPKLDFLANRIAYLVLSDPKHDWNQYDRGWRYQQLKHRAQGKQFVK